MSERKRTLILHKRPEDAAPPAPVSRFSRPRPAGDQEPMPRRPGRDYDDHQRFLARATVVPPPRIMQHMGGGVADRRNDLCRGAGA